MGRRQADHLLVHGLGGGGVFVGQVAHESGGVQGQGQARQLFQGGHFRGEVEASLLQGIEEGFFAEAVPGAEQAAARRVPEGKGKHAVKPGQAVRPPEAVGFEDHFRI